MSRPEHSTTDLTIITVLRNGRHLSYHTQLQTGDNPHTIASAHCQVRSFYNDGHVERFVVINGAEVQSMEARP